jgi:hypothetical protein
MKDFKYFPLVFLLQLLLILFIPGLAKGVEDRIWLVSICVVYGLIFILGTRKIISAFESSQSQFNAKYFGAMGMRMLTGIILIGIYLKFSGAINKPGTIFLICSYFVLMGFEIKIILSKLRTNSEKSKNTDDARK